MRPYGVSHRRPGSCSRVRIWPKARREPLKERQATKIPLLLPATTYDTIQGQSSHVF